MAIKTNSPQVAALLDAAEQKYGHPIRTASDFLSVAYQVEDNTREHISDSTIKRLWKPSLGYDTISERTLDVLARFVGFNHFDAFVCDLNSRDLIDSEIIESKDCIKSADLEIGQMVSIAWMPDRECIVRYLGNRKFEAVECKNSKLQAGDTFSCSTFIKGRKLYVDDLTHGDDVFECYVMGTQHGLTRAELVK